MARLYDIIVETFSLEESSIGSIVYTVFKNTLIFDRNIGGVIVEKEECDHIFSSAEKKRTSSICSNGKQTTPINVDFKLLPVTVLEHILTFLPDEASGSLPMVCKVWNTEIGKTSPALWQYLLSRRDWPGLLHISLDTTDDVSTLTEKTKEIFISHKIICQVVENTIKGYLQLGNGELVTCQALAMQAFKDPREINDNKTVISAIRLWDDSTLITSNRTECILSIFKAMKSEESTLGLYCKQLVNIRVAPFPQSKKNKCELQSFDLDKNSILCCFEVNCLCNWLLLVKREDLLVNSAESILETNFFRKYELTELFADYHKSMEDETFIRFMGGRDWDEMETSIKGDIVACDGGHFVFVVDIFTLDDMTLIGRMIVQFSARRESLTWCKPVSHLRDAKSTYLSAYNSIAKTVVYTSTMSEPIVTLHFEQRQGIVKTSLHTNKLQVLPLDSHVDELWEMSPLSPTRFSAISHSHMVFADILTNDAEEESKVVLSFVSQETDENFDDPSFLSIDYVQHISSVHIHQDYIILLCGRNCFDIDDIDGHWFGDENIEQEFCAIIVHIPSKTLIYRRNCVVDKHCNLHHIKFAFGSDSLPMIFAAGDKGVLMSGQLLRDVKVKSQGERLKSSTKTKLKKKKKGFKSNKKDGFARGMSMRG